ncbi:talin-2-like [Palaemon carinicauda]|uniref:talin-2-like n=1 Tax=Palaemon carinicauda TaxID=392227 RepID=UPI0035B582C7
MALALKVHIVDQNGTKMMQFDPAMTILEACGIIRMKITDSNLGPPKDYGLFLPDEGTGKGVWLESGKSLSYYILRNQDVIEYRKKVRQLKIRMLDGTVKTMLVDDSQPVSQIMVVICAKIGIMNHDEYSLVIDMDEEEAENKPSFGTLTLKRKKEGEKDKDRDAKMEQLKKKIRTDDEFNWVDHSRTLRDQGIEESDILLLRRKYFFSDQNIDSRDPVQLNLLYVQCRDTILDATHPVTQDRACNFAGIQCQIQFGDYKENKHKPGFLDLKEFLPQCYVKTKGIEKKVFNEHKLFSGKSELEAKVIYVGQARSLKTFGVTFFLVKEKMAGKNKLVPRLLGITKDSVLRLDEKTKEILKTWPLTTVRRWAASPNTFTLDFGDYSDQYYSVQTPDGEQISQLIAGYIDIIMKRQKKLDHIGIEGDDGASMVEDTVAPSKASTIQYSGSNLKQTNNEFIALPGILAPGAVGAQDASTKMLPGTGTKQVRIDDRVDIVRQRSSVVQPNVITILSKPQKGLVSTIEAGKHVISDSMENLNSKVDLPEIGSDPASMKWKEVTLDSKRQIVVSQIAAMNAATAEITSLSSPAYGDVDHTAIGASIQTITSNLADMSNGVKMIAALSEKDGNSSHLLGATKNLCESYSDLIEAANPQNKKPHQELLQAASHVGEASNAVLHTLDGEMDHETQDILLGKVESLGNNAAALIVKAKAQVVQCEDQELQNAITDEAQACAIATAQLCACARIMSPTIDNPICQSHMVDATKEVGRTVENIIQQCQNAVQDDTLLADCNNAADEVRKNLADLLDFVRTSGEQRKRQGVHDEALETILMSSEKLYASQGNAAEMLRQAKSLAQAASYLVESINFEAESETDPAIKSRLLESAEKLAEATENMIEKAKQCALNPHDEKCQAELKEAAENVRIVANAATGNALNKKIIKSVENAAKLAAATGIQCMAAAQGAGPHNSSAASQEELLSDGKAVGDCIPMLVAGVKGTINDIDSSKAQLALINACNQFLNPGTKMVSSAKSALPTITDQASALQLNNSAKQFGQALVDLRSAIGKAQEACSSLEIDSALDSIQNFNNDLNDLQEAAGADTLRPLPGETQESTTQHLAKSTKAVGSNMAQLLSSALQGNQHFTGLASRDATIALKDYNSAVRGVVATSDNHDLRNRLIAAAREVMLRSSELIGEAQVVVQNPSDSASKGKLIDIAKSVAQAQSIAINNLPGQQEVDDAITDIEYSTNDLYEGNFPTSSKQYGELQSELQAAAEELNNIIFEVGTSARTSGQHLATVAKKVPLSFGILLNSGMEMAGSMKDGKDRDHMVEGLKELSILLPKLLFHAKGVSLDPNSANTKNNLASAARSLTDAMNNLLNVCTTAAPEQKECDNAIHAIRSQHSLLDQPSEQINDLSYYECLGTVMESSKVLGEAMTGIVSHAKNQDHDKFGRSVRGVSDAICGLAESATQAVYLVGIGDPSSVIGRPGLVDQAQFCRASESLSEACDVLKDPSSNRQQILNAATVIAKHTSALCNSCQASSAKTNNPVSKRHFVQSAKNVAHATANLVKDIKALSVNDNEETRARCSEDTKPLLEAVDNLCAFANSPEFAPVPSKISSKAREAQVPIISASKAILDGSCAMLEIAKSLVLNPKDAQSWQGMAKESKGVSDSVKTLVFTIRDKAPGQKECDQAVDKLNMNIRDLDQAFLSMMDQGVQQHNENNIQGFNEQVENAGHALLSSVEKVRDSAKNRAEMLGHSVFQMSNYFDPLVAAAISSASNMASSKKQRSLLDQAKNVAECALQLVYASKESGGNGKATEAHQEVDEAANATKQALKDLLSLVEGIATEAGVVTGLVESITTAMNRTEDPAMAKTATTGDDFVEYQTRMVTAAKEIARLAQDMIGKAATDPSQMGTLGAAVSHQYNSLAADSFGAMRQANNSDVAFRLRSSIHELGQACIDLVKSGGTVQASPGDSYNQRELAESARQTGEKASHVLAALQAGSRGTQACIDANSTVAGIIGDLDTTVMFASAGTLSADGEGEKFSDHRDNIMKDSLTLDENAKALVAGASSSQEKLAQAAQCVSSTIVHLAEAVKSGAASLGSNHPEEQVMLINAVKDVALSLSDLLHCTKGASGKPPNDPTMVTLKESAQVMENNTASLLKAVEAVEDEHTRGTRALEATIEAIAKEIKIFNSDEVPKTKATPEELVRSAKPITIAAAKAVGAGNSLKQEDVIVAANLGRKAISDMLVRCKAAAVNAETPEIQTKVLTAGRDSAERFRTLLQTVLHLLNEPGPNAAATLADGSKNTAQSISELVSAAESLKGVDWEDPDDPTVIAETELLGAAKSIDAAARKLMALKPRRQKSESDDEPMHSDEIILESCKSLAPIIRTLIEAAAAAQRELVESGKVSRCPSIMSDDGQWSEGLISAAKFVAAATHCLVEAANSLMQGHSSEEKLISSARQVAASTAQLLVACKVKADPYSKAMKRLQVAGNACKRATDRLVKEARKSTEQEEEFTVVLKTRHVAGMAQEIEAREQVRKIEDDLARARSKLSSILRKKYRDASATGAASTTAKRESVVSKDRVVAGMEQEIEAREKILRVEGSLAKARAKLEVILRERHKDEDSESVPTTKRNSNVARYESTESAYSKNRKLKITYKAHV